MKNKDSYAELIDTADTMGSDPMVKKSFRDTLSPHGVCSRLPHPRRISRDSHGQISTHVYILHIIPFLGC